MPNNKQESANDFYYDSKGKKVALERAPGYFCVRFSIGGRADDPSLPEKEQRFLRYDSENIDFITQYGMQMYKSRVRDDKAIMSELMALNATPTITYATPVFQRSSHPEDLVAVTNRFLIEFSPEISAQQANTDLIKLMERYGVSLIEHLSYTLPAQGFLLQAPTGEGPNGPIALAQKFYEELPLQYAIPDLVQRRAVHQSPVCHLTQSEDTPTREQRDFSQTNWTYRDQQWHLAVAKVQDAWREHTQGDPNIVIAISDDGVDIEHTEFEGKLAGQFDFAFGIPNGTPKSMINNHGTACAGVAVARGVHARGVAPNCKMMVVRFPNYLGVADEARMFEWMSSNGADIINCSWGPPDGTGASYPLPDNVASSIRFCVNSGRGGLGIPIIWAAGNGNELISLDGYAANPNVIAIAACNERELRSHYSDFGPEIAICAPSSGDQSAGDRRIFSTDRRGNEGYNSGGGTTKGDIEGNYTNDFGGTSSAAPLVAGVVGLMLSVNPDLTWRQVKQILMVTADKIGNGYDAEGHSDYFGHGRINAYAAVNAAKSSGPVTAAIEGPSNVSPSDPPPIFNVSLPPNRYYAIEVATESRLFRSGTDTEDRTSLNFFATWQLSAFLSLPDYQLPATVWNELKTADRLFYRMWVNASSKSWLDFYATTPGDQSQNAPFIDLTSNKPQIHTSITAAASYAHDSGPPSFHIETPSDHFYAVELATDSLLFDAANHAHERNSNNFFATWTASSFLSSPEYILQADVWDRLKSTQQLFYRIWVSADNDTWVGFFSTTPDNASNDAPFLRITNSQEGEYATVIGPTLHSRDGGPPEFEIYLPQGRFFAIEVATQARLFDEASNSLMRTPCNFYASWATEKMKSEYRYVIPQATWDRLKKAQRLYYRLWTSDSDQAWKSPLTTTENDAFATSPFILVTDT